MPGPTTPEPEKPFKKGDTCVLKVDTLVWVTNADQHKEIKGQRLLPKGSAVTIRDDPTFALLTGDNEFRSPDYARYRIECKMSLNVYVPRNPPVYIRTSQRGLIHENLRPVWPNDHNLRKPFFEGMIVKVKTDAFFNDKINKVKASALFRITCPHPLSPGGLPVSAESKLLPKAAYDGYEVQPSEKEFVLGNSSEDKIPHNQLEKA
ncbi:hypothetical protein H0H93_014542 [Arthromyces matolae]|nr:hypothetical protein H0H93_014542 [Arthromyces matolae]